MGRTHINLLSTQKNLLADYVRFRGGVGVCVFILFPPLVTWKQDKGGRRGKEKSEHHLYVKAHLSWGENRWMQTEKNAEIKTWNNL